VSSTQPRTPKGTPTGGRYAATAHTETDIGLEPQLTDAERWSQVFDRHQRAVLTRAGVAPERWLEAAEALPEVGIGRVDHEALIEAQRHGVDPALAAAVIEVTGGQPNAFHRLGRIPGLDQATVRSVPDDLRPIDPSALETMLASGIDMDRLAAAHRHNPLARLDTRGARSGVRTVEIAEAQITSDEAARSGSGDDWHRALLVREAGMDPELAAAWPADIYPPVIEALEGGGWKPGDLTAEGACGRAFAWARQSVDAEGERAWTGAGFAHAHDAKGYLEAGLSAPDAAKWRKVGDDPDAMDRFVGDYVAAGVTVEQAAAASRSLVVDYEAPTLIAQLTPDELDQWCIALGVTKARSESIRPWRELAGISDTGRVAQWRQLMHTDDRRELRFLTPGEIGFIDRQVGPDRVAGTPDTHPLVLATADHLGMDVAQLEGQVGSRAVVEACRTAFARRRVAAPF
jgi:hypothetical protein